MPLLTCLQRAAVLALVATAALRCDALAQAELHAIRTQSPDGRVAIRVAETRDGGGNRRVVYDVRYRGVALFRPSALGIDIVEGGFFGDSLRLGAVSRRAHDATVRGLIGKASVARDRYHESVIPLLEQRAPHRRVELVVRAYDDGVAFRYRLPEQPALHAITIRDERTELALEPRDTTYALVRDGYVSSYEGFYTIGAAADLPRDTLLALPLLVHHERGGWFAVSEADLTDYAGLYLRTAHTLTGAYESRLSPLPGSPGVAVRARAPFSTPWRVIMVAGAPERLIESNLIALLNPPSAIRDVSWIHPGKTTFPWWNDYVLPDTTFAAGLNTATAKYYIDFCAAHGIPYHTLDGYQDKAWYGGGIDPGNTVPDVTTGNPALDLPEVLRYAASKGVRIRAWMHWRALKPQLDTALARYERMGLEGIMVDFMDRDDQEMVAFYHEILAKAAAHHLTVIFHGAYKPTGLSRTWPNLMTVEAVMGLEYDKFEGARGVTPAHELLVPFTRMLAGPLDFHQGGFRYSSEAAFHTTYTGPRVIGTRARTLATYIVYEDYLPMLADAPSAYQGQPGFAFAVGTPTTWDETRVVHGTIGQVLAVARRKGRSWYVGTMTDGHARQVDIPLSFLGAGEYDVELYSDNLAPGAVAVPDSLRGEPAFERRVVRAGSLIHARLAPAGGHAMRLSPRAP